MFSGGIKASKGSFLLLDALAQLDPALPVTLDVYGAEGTSPGQTARDYRARCEELGLADKVRYHGMVSGIAEQYRCHDLLVVASRAEAFGRVTAEGMLCGCAVVGSDSGGPPELIADDRGYLFEPNDAASLAAAITEAVEDPAERARRVKRARSYARDNFTVNTYVDKVEALYRAVLA